MDLLYLKQLSIHNNNNININLQGYHEKNYSY